MINLEIAIKDGSRDNNGLLNMSIKNIEMNKSSDVSINMVQIFKTLKFVPSEKKFRYFIFCNICTFNR
ncbi:MAG: hypothetical protein KN64_15070 [Sulfurovum sp. AS07-7]|nr:MAG: hypothetical protein KN64_15070 [Sulfurovum sp. AS07-7]